MRQAGRSLPEYRSIRGSGSILDAIADPELSAEITMQPVRRYGVDAAIQQGIDLDGSPIPAEMLSLYKEVMELESQRARSGVKKSMRNRIVKTGSKHFDQSSLDARLKAAGWEGLKEKEIAFFYS